LALQIMNPSASREGWLEPIVQQAVTYHEPI
jgi:hypothetical protein